MKLFMPAAPRQYSIDSSLFYDVKGLNCRKIVFIVYLCFVYELMCGGHVSLITCIQSM